jgi:drug/metabolite transporter (DMT)-like permease
LARRLSDTQRGLIFILIGTFCFSAKAVLVKLAYQYPVDAVTLLTLRMGLSLPFYLVIGWFVFRNAPIARLTPRDHALVIGYGFVGYYLASLFDLMGLQYISASFERLILYLYPTIVLLLSALFFKRRISSREWLALVLGYLGIALVYARDAAIQGPEVFTGMVLILLCALTFAIYVVGSGQMIPRIGAMSFTTYAMTVACVAILVHFVLTRPLSWLAVRWELWLISGTIAVFSTVLPTFLMAWGIKLLGAPRAALIGAAGPMFTSFLGYYALGEPFTWVHAAGTALVVGAVLSISTQRTRSPARAREEPEP